jgi:hypothetical protein
MLKTAVAAAALAATPTSYVLAATLPGAGNLPAKITLDLADGRKIELINRNGIFTARLFSARGKLIDAAPTGKLALKSGKTIGLNGKSQLFDGTVSDNTGFVLICCDPDPNKPCRTC